MESFKFNVFFRPTDEPLGSFQVVGANKLSGYFERNVPLLETPLLPLGEFDGAPSWHVVDSGAVYIAVDFVGSLYVDGDFSKGDSLDCLSDAQRATLEEAADRYIKEARIVQCPESGIVVRLASALKVSVPISKYDLFEDEPFVGIEFVEHFDEGLPSYCWFSLGELIEKGHEGIAELALGRMLECEGDGEDEKSIARKIEGMLIQAAALHLENADKVSSIYDAMDRSKHDTYETDVRKWRTYRSGDSILDRIRQFDGGNMDASIAMKELRALVGLLDEVKKFEDDELYEKSLARLVGE